MDKLVPLFALIYFYIHLHFGCFQKETQKCQLGLDKGLKIHFSLSLPCVSSTAFSTTRKKPFSSFLPPPSPPHPTSVILSIPTFPATDTFPAPKWRCHSVSHRSRQILTHFNRNTHLVMMITIRLRGHLGLLRLLNCTSVSIHSNWNHSLILKSQI